MSQKKDGYYVVTAKACSCPSAVYNPGKPCKRYIEQDRKSVSVRAFVKLTTKGLEALREEKPLFRRHFVLQADTSSSWVWLGIGQLIPWCSPNMQGCRQGESLELPLEVERDVMAAMIQYFFAEIRSTIS